MEDLIVVLDNATTELYYARLVPQENTLTTMQALRAAVEKRRGVFCTLYTDMASHFVTTRCADAPHRNQKPCLPPTQIQRALGQLSIELIQAHSPQARERMERLWSTKTASSSKNSNSRYHRATGVTASPSAKSTVYQHLNGTIRIGYGPHTLGPYDSQGRLLPPSQTDPPHVSGCRGRAHVRGSHYQR